MYFCCPFKNGDLSEWLKEHAWKVCIRETVSRVRIPQSPQKQKTSRQRRDFLFRSVRRACSGECAEIKKQGTKCRTFFAFSIPPPRDRRSGGNPISFTGKHLR